MSEKKHGGNPPTSTRWKKGQSGNPLGRPPKRDGTIFSEVSMSLLKCAATKENERIFRANFPDFRGKVTNLVFIVGRAINKASQGSVKHAEFIAERTFGKVPTTVEMEQHLDGRIDFDGLAALLCPGEPPEE